MADTHNNRTRARDVFWRFYDVYHRGHAEYMHHARRLEDYYLGGGRQWRADDRAAVEAQGRPAREVNTILPTVNAAAGYQIQNRMDIGFLPKNAGASEEVAKVLSKVVKHSLDNTSYRYHETDAFLDGLIQQRGWLDIRMDYGDSTTGDIKVESLDPLDVLPDPDAKSYNPDGWTDVRITRWMTAREIEETYGRDAAKEVELSAHAYLGHDFGDVRIHSDGAASVRNSSRRSLVSSSSSPAASASAEGSPRANNSPRRQRMSSLAWSEPKASSAMNNCSVPR